MNKINDTCPYCGINLNYVQNDKSIHCRGNNCNYTFYIKNSIEEANDLLNEITSFGNKEIFQHKSGTYFVSAWEEPKPFKINYISEIISEHYLKFLHRGFIEKINSDQAGETISIPASIVFIDISQPSEINHYRIISANIFHDLYCDTINSNEELKSELCIHSSFEQIRDIIKSEEIQNSDHDDTLVFERRCHSNKIHLLTPIIINKRIMGFIVFGCYLKKGETINVDERINSVVEEEYLNATIMDAQNKSITDTTINLIKKNVLRNKEVVQNFISTIYKGKRQLVESYFFNYLNERIFRWDNKNVRTELNEKKYLMILKGALDEINNFSSVHYSFLLLNSELNPSIFKLIAVSSNPWEKINDYVNVSQTKFIAEFIHNNNIIYSKRNNDQEFFKTFKKLFVEYKPKFYAAIPLTISKKLKGILILVNRSTLIDNKYKNSCSPSFEIFLQSMRRELEMGLGILSHELKRNSVMSNISHEIINPLDKMKGRVEFMLNHFEYIRGVKYRHQLKLTLEDLLQKTNEMEKKTRSIIRLDKEEEKLKLNQIELLEIIKHNVHMLKPRARVKNIMINFKKIEESWIPKFYLNEDAFSGAIFNLLENAIKYSHEFTEIDLEMGFDKIKECYYLNITNLGIGVLEEEREKIFELEERGSNVSTDGGGLGRGLYIAREILSRHVRNDFHITLELSQLNNPTVFKINIPKIFRI